MDAMKQLLAIAIVLILRSSVDGPVAAQSTAAASADRLLRAAIECLADADMARDALQSVTGVGSAIEDASHAMTASRSAIGRFQGCRSRLNDVTPVSEGTATALKGMQATFDLLAIAFERSVRLDEELLEMATEAELRRAAPEARAVSDGIDEAWRFVPYAVVAVTAGMVDEPRTSSPPTAKRLRITRAQVTAARASLLDRFPHAATPQGDDRHVVDFSAELLLRFFDERWLASDEQEF